ncbi:MAG: hypothetical protein HDR09_18060 [Lachnospiraceae bacterium]|nr:hypothetical protein [Lachnospiraceae bacterium]
MKYFSLDTVFNAYKRNSKSTSNKFWGILGILVSIKQSIVPGKSYLIHNEATASFLENLFALGDKRDYSSVQSINYAIFSDKWVEKIDELMCSSTPNFYDVAVWFFRNERFLSTPSSQDLIALFSERTGFSKEQISQLFSFYDSNLQFEDSKYNDRQLLSLIGKEYGNEKHYTSVTAEGTFIKANPGEFSRAPFIQTLYAAQQTTECLLITQFPLADLYHTLSVDKSESVSSNVQIEIPLDSDNSKSEYYRAMRTKPFLLLAGISGTGKSRIVKQMAFDSCPNNAVLRSDPTSPGNYCLIEVKPNWHDSTELLGYESKIGGAHYQLTPFVKFLAKAMLHPDVPFFVCLDEMNLAPVEQYFAEFLSVLESRTKLENGHIVSEPLIKAEIFRKYNMENSLFSLEEATAYNNASATVDPQSPYGKEIEVYNTLREHGLRIPENVVVIGTVNMDETTHQFSRKVIDRAMTIEMNLPEGDPFMDFFANASDLSYRSNPTSASLYLATETKAKDVIEALSADNAEKTEWLKGEIAGVLTALNNALDGTSFKVAYRVQNELMLYFYQLWLEDKTAKWREILNSSVDQILMMKVLPRVEGDEELLEKPLDRLIEFAEPYTNSKKKLDEMQQRLQQSRFASFWP